MQFYVRGSITFVIILMLLVVVSGQQFNMQGRTALLPYWSPRLRPTFNFYQPQEDKGLMLDYPVIQLQRHLLDKQRFLFASSTFTNPFFKVVTFTIVSTVNITNVQNCIPSGLFVAASINVACRRKKRGILIDSSDALEENFQFPVNPSKPQRFMSTEIAAIDELTQENRQFPTNIVSSKDEITSDEISLEREHLRKSKKFLQQYFGSTTVYSYSLSTVTSTRTISPITGGQQLLCRPSGYAVC